VWWPHGVIVHTIWMRSLHTTLNTHTWFMSYTMNEIFTSKNHRWLVSYIMNEITGYSSSLYTLDTLHHYTLEWDDYVLLNEKTIHSWSLYTLHHFTLVCRNHVSCMYIFIYSSNIYILFIHYEQDHCISYDMNKIFTNYISNSYVPYFIHYIVSTIFTNYTVYTIWIRVGWVCISLIV